MVTHGIDLPIARARFNPNAGNTISLENGSTINHHHEFAMANFDDTFLCDANPTFKEQGCAAESP